MREFKHLFLIVFVFIVTQNTMGQPLKKDREIRFLALGDSYTIGESVAESHIWPVQLLNNLRKEGYQCAEPNIIATTGWRTDDLKKAIHAFPFKTKYDLVSLLIGVNNQYQGKSVEGYAKEFEELLQIAIAHAGGDKSKVFVVSIPDYGFTPFGKKNQKDISKAIDSFNAVNKRITELYGVQYIDITGISRRGLEEPELVAEDGLHPSAKMYEEWVLLIMKNL